MEEQDLSQLNEAEIMDMYSDVIESGMIRLGANCPRGYHGQGVGGPFCCVSNYDSSDKIKCYYS